jgi:alpha-1,3-rhamnosyl/mannosyltransferase
LVIAGTWDPRYPESRQRAEALALKEAVHFLGPIVEEDLPTLYSGAVAFVFPSEYEGFGLPVLEAMACGTPVACSNTSSLAEVAGDAALLFDPTDVAAIADALTHLLHEPSLWADLRERGLRRTAQFSWERTARDTLAVYRQTVRGVRSRTNAKTP